MSISLHARWVEKDLDACLELARQQRGVLYVGKSGRHLHLRLIPQTQAPAAPANEPRRQHA